VPPIPDTTAKKRVHDADLAWDLIEQCRSRLDVKELNKTFVTVGTGDYERVIETMMNLAVHKGSPVSEELTSELARWVEKFHDHEHYGYRLRLLNQIVEMSQSRSRR
jgi:hypothetical protein